MNSSSLRLPSAWLPPAMSVLALAVVLGHIAAYGTARAADEGAAAHIFQLLIAGQVPFVMFFALRWLPKDPKRGWQVLALQAVAAMAALTPVWYYNL